MSYTRIVQYGNITELYLYEKNRTNNRRPYVSSLTKKRAKKKREEAKKKGFYKRSKRNILRSIKSFFQLCHHNNCIASSIHFFTLTFAYEITYKEACRNVARFMEKVKKHFPTIPLSYISVPELTKKGRFHFHLLVYNLPSEKTITERKTRNFQVLFERGYIDIMPASYTSEGLAGYMAKYMAKALRDEENETTRGFNCSRNIERPRSKGSNTLNQYLDLIIPTVDIEILENREYDVPYLGKCLMSRVKLKS